MDKLKPRIKDTAMILWKVYLAFTVAQTILLMLGGMDLFDSLCHTFGTIATGGFSTKNESIGFYKSVYIDAVVTTFMLIGGGLAEIDMRNPRVLRTVTREDGLLSNETAWLESLKAGENGFVYFVTPKGLTIYNPELDRAISIAPLMYFRESHFQEDNSGQNELSLAWVALSYANEKQVRYKTRLRNYDDDWSAETFENKIRYTNLPAFFTPDLYTFEVLAANNSGLWSELPLTFSFKVSPPWWMRWWLRAARPR